MDLKAETNAFNVLLKQRTQKPYFIMTKFKPTTVDEFIDAAQPEGQEKLREIRAILKKAAPDATETLKWGNPVYEEKRILFAFSAFKKHMNFMPTQSSLEPFKEELKDFTTGKDTVQFPYDKPLPIKLIQKIAAHRIKDVRENNALWMTKK
jgi:uncharacterized protein YdhG (YjbR/CyaY superfamily)